MGDKHRRPVGRISSHRLTLNRRWHPSTRDNSMYKWQDGNVIGCLEVPSEPFLDVRGVLKPMRGLPRSDAEEEAQFVSGFKRAQREWDERNLHDTFIEACESMPASTVCCGLLMDDDKTVRELVPHLNRVWAGEASRRMESAGFAVDTFLWSWNNLQGKSETYVLLIRFHELKEGSGRKMRSSSHKSANRSSSRSLSSLKSANERRKSSAKKSPTAADAVRKSVLKEPTIGREATVETKSSLKESPKGKGVSAKMESSSKGSSTRTDATSESKSSLGESPKGPNTGSGRTSVVNDSETGTEGVTAM